MCTIMLRPENWRAMRASKRQAQEEVDELMRKEREAMLSKQGTNDPNGGLFGSFTAPIGRIYVWLDRACYGNSIGNGFYYVRDHPLREHYSTAYDSPSLIVAKSKLRPEQIEFMERKCEETRRDEEIFTQQGNGVRL